jgi:hypothetical protein
MPTGQKRAIVMFYVASTRKFYFEADIAKGAVKKEDVDEAMFKPTEEIFEAQRRIFNVNETFREVYTSMLKVDKKMTAAMSADDDLGALGLEWEKFEDTMIRQTEEMSSRRDDVADGPESPMETWSKGRGVTPPELYMQLGVNYDFHGPAGGGDAGHHLHRRRGARDGHERGRQVAKAELGRRRGRAVHHG